MKEIEQIVTDYLKAENTDYAILINGDWGSGKTHYIKNSLFNKISKIDSFQKDKNNSIEKYSPLYVSLYGLNDVGSIIYKVQLELNQWLKSKSWKVTQTGLSKLASIFSVDISKDDEQNFLSIFNIPKNKVLFFDDLERIDKEKLSLSSVLGQINHFTEQDNLKVIIVCNSKKTEEIFSKINEKTIRFACLYNPALRVVYDDMISAYSMEYQNFLKENKSDVIEIFEVANYKNLRTLRFILDIFQKIYNVAKEVEYKDEILKRFLYFTTIYSIEYKTDTSNEKLSSLKDVSPHPILDVEVFNKMILKNQEEEKPEQEPSYIQKFNKKYESVIESFHYSREIADYIHNGYLNKEKLKFTINEISQEIKRTKGTEEDKLIKEIKNWRNLKDEDFEPLKEKIFEKVDNGAFSLAGYPIIFGELLQIDHYQLYNFTADDEIIDRFKKGIDKAKETHEYSESFRSKIPYWSESDTSSAKDKFNDICKYTQQANKESLNKIHREIVDSLLLSLKENKSQELQDIVSNLDHLNYPFFESIDVENFFNHLEKANQETVFALHASIYGRYSDRDINYEPVYHKEKEFFKKLRELVTKKIEETTERKISLVPFIDLERNLKRFK